ncbi:MAG TPA: V-type ATP synthase subunit D [Bacteroidaceae bacterium]|nr:V-type ATP synthase subunit D [Bacteroidaceae bacterium]
MSVKFQYNKTSLQALDKQLRIRLRALPTLKNKESALRMEVKNAKIRKKQLEDELEKIIENEDKSLMMWDEFDPALISVSDIRLKFKKIAGVKIPELDEVFFNVREFDVFVRPKWFLGGVEIMKTLMKLAIDKELTVKKQEVLEYARKKTTQKVNLFEKVQIPDYENAIRKIKRYLEDEDNLAKAAQKIVKSRQQKAAEARL